MSSESFDQTANSPDTPTGNGPNENKDSNLGGAPVDSSGPPEFFGDSTDGPRVVQTDQSAKDGLVKCPRCGATEISLNPTTGLLRCHFCRHEWAAKKALDSPDLNGDIHNLRGLILGSGAADIIPSTDVNLTFRCGACGAEVIIDTSNSTQARCHWCRNKLSMNQQVPNGAVPDMLLPFSIPKADAVNKISEFVRKRRFFANPQFTKEFDPENVMGVYFPYMVIDVNAHARMTGQGEHLVRRYTVKRGDENEDRYDADLYNIQREFDIHINDLTVETSGKRLNQNTRENANNIINSVMPFDVENSVKYDSNYLAGFTSERRDTNIEHLTPLVRHQTQDIARHAALKTIEFYDRGVRWEDEQISVIGERWVSAYLPVWLYSYLETKKNGSTFLHYVAVNARTGETMGSVPINKTRLLLTSAAVQVLGTIVFTILMVVG